MKISARVAGIISRTEVAFTAGSEKGVAEDDLAVIFRDIEVRDPDSNEVIGVVKRPILRFRITEVQPRMSVGQTFEHVGGDDENPFALFGQGRKVVTVTSSPNAVARGVVYVPVGAPVEIDHDDLP